MKIKNILMSIASMCAVACSNDGNNTPSPADIAGSYAGYTLAGCAYFSNSVSDGETVTITANADGTAHVVLMSDSWGELSVQAAQLSCADGVYTLSGNGTARMGMEGNVSSYDCTFTGRIESSDKAQMRFEIPAVMGGMTIDFATGAAPADLLLAGTYEGYTDADCAYFQDRYTDGESLTITANGDGTLAVSFESASWGTFSVASAAVTASEGGYAITGSGSVAMGMGGASSSYDFTMNGVINASKESFSIAFDVPAVMGGLTVTLLSGQAPAADQQ